MEAKSIDQLLNFENDLIEDLEILLELDEKSPNTIVIKPVGSINLYSNSYFQEKINLLIDLGFINLIFDLSKIENISAVGIGSIIHAVQRVNKYNGEIFLNNLPMQIIDVFKLPGLRKYFSMEIEKNFVLKSKKDRVFT